MTNRRWLVRLPNRGGYDPSQASRLLRELREAKGEHPGEIMNLRVNPLALEFDLFTAEAQSLEPYWDAWADWGRPWTVRDLAILGPTDPAAAMPEARALWNEQRFWEVHEVLEGAWKASRDPDRRWLQGFILAAASGVHQQRNEPQVLATLLAKALDCLKDAPDEYYGWKLAPFRTWIRHAIANPLIMRFPTV